MSADRPMLWIPMVWRQLRVGGNTNAAVEIAERWVSEGWEVTTEQLPGGRGKLLRAALATDLAGGAS